MTFLSILLHPASLAVVAGLLTFCFMKLDCKVSSEDKKTSAYCKNILLVSLLVGGAAYLINAYSIKSMKGGGPTVILEDVALGEPDF